MRDFLPNPSFLPRQATELALWELEVAVFRGRGCGVGEGAGGGGGGAVFPVRTDAPLPSSCGKGLWGKPEDSTRTVLAVLGNPQEASARCGQSRGSPQELAGEEKVPAPARAALHPATALLHRQPRRLLLGRHPVPEPAALPARPRGPPAAGPRPRAAPLHAPAHAEPGAPGLGALQQRPDRGARPRRPPAAAPHAPDAHAAGAAVPLQ